MAKKGGGSTTVTNQADPLTQNARQQAYGSTLAATQGQAGVDPQTQQAIDYFSKLTGYGGQGAAALGGDQAAIGKLMNPYLDSVVGAAQGDFDRQAGKLQSSIGADATSAHAFGGSRYGVALGEGLGQLRGQQAQTLAGLRYQGFGDAMQRAGGLANLGFGAAGQLPQLGQYAQMMNDPQQRNMKLWTKFLGMNGAGSTATQTQKSGKNGLTGALGGAASGAELGSTFGPWGTAIGGGLGGLIGMFG